MKLSIKSESAGWYGTETVRYGHGKVRTRYVTVKRTPAYIPENLLREAFLPPFAAGVLAGSKTLMINYGAINFFIY